MIKSNVRIEGVYTSTLMEIERTVCMVQVESDALWRHCLPRLFVSSLISVKTPQKIYLCMRLRQRKRWTCGLHTPPPTQVNRVD